VYNITGSNVLDITFTPTTQSTGLNGQYHVWASSRNTTYIPNIGIAFSNDDNAIWGSASGTYNPDGTYKFTTGVGGVYGEYLKVQFPVSFIPNRYGFLQNTGLNPSRPIAKHSFLGSTDGNNWVVLNAVDTTTAVVRESSWYLNTSNSYTYYALVVRAVGAGVPDVDVNLRIWKQL
jgi:hypothetical protein